jgi:tRNA G18 (ribose-2'-O)-methylase SpoU
MPFARLVPWPTGLDQVRAAGFVVAALAPRPPASPGIPTLSFVEVKARLAEGEPSAGVALLLGAEGPGLTEGALAASDVVVPIPMAHDVDSLNVATAAAVAFHALTAL